jgi:hypothetical protein
MTDENIAVTSKTSSESVRVREQEAYLLEFSRSELPSTREAFSAGWDACMRWQQERSAHETSEICSCGHHNRYHFADGRGYIRCRYTKECRCGWRIHEDAAVDPDAVPPVRPPEKAKGVL